MAPLGENLGDGWGGEPTPVGASLLSGIEAAPGKSAPCFPSDLSPCLISISVGAAVGWCSRSTQPSQTPLAGSVYSESEFGNFLNCDSSLSPSSSSLPSHPIPLANYPECAFYLLSGWHHKCHFSFYAATSHWICLLGFQPSSSFLPLHPSCVEIHPFFCGATLCLSLDKYLCCSQPWELSAGLCLLFI